MITIITKTAFSSCEESLIVLTEPPPFLTKQILFLETTFRWCFLLASLFSTSIPILLESSHLLGIYVSELPGVCFIEPENGLGWKGPQGLPHSNTPAMCRDALHETCLLKALPYQATSMVIWDKHKFFGFLTTSPVYPENMNPDLFWSFWKLSLNSIICWFYAGTAQSVIEGFSNPGTSLPHSWSIF